MRTIARFVLGAGLLAIAFPAGAGSMKVTQKDFSFSEKEISVRPGDTVTFVNGDQVPHNVYSLTKGLEFELRSQTPGQSDSVPFPKPGTAEVRCAIHPKMKMTVHVAP